jgi:hypothetical protein
MEPEEAERTRRLEQLKIELNPCPVCQFFIEAAKIMRKLNDVQAKKALPKYGCKHCAGTGIRHDELLLQWLPILKREDDD